MTRYRKSVVKKIERKEQPYNATGQLIDHNCITFVEALAKAIKEDKEKKE